MEVDLTFTLWAQDGCSYTSCGALQSNSFTVTAGNSLLIPNVSYLNGSGFGGAYWLASASACTHHSQWNYSTSYTSSCGTFLIGTQCGGYPAVDTLFWAYPCGGGSSGGFTAWSQDGSNNVIITVDYIP